MMDTARSGNPKGLFFSGLAILAILILSWFQLQVSCICHSPAELLHADLKFILLSIAVESILLIFLLLIVRSLRLACGIFILLCTILSVVNRFTILWHDSPLTLADLKNFKTAVNVLGSYRLNIYAVLGLLIIFMAEGFLVYQLKRLPNGTKMTWKQRTAATAGWCFAALGIVFFGYLSPQPLMPQKSGFTWITDYQEYGYVNCTIRAAQQVHQAVNLMKKPDQYDSMDMDTLQIEEDMPAEHTHETPDIILILNETFYDLSLLVDLETDVPYMSNIDSMDNTIRGYAVNPAGGTNSSEYELLTGNSSKPIHGIYPFITLDMNNANSVVSHLEALGYTTTGAHCAQSENYNRGRAYTAMGFDHTYFFDDFMQPEHYGDRWYATDASVYRNLLSWYQNGDTAVPQLFYMLTIQNHGGWQVNPSESDLVHAKGDFGEYGDQIDEYLSCIYLSDQAFKEFTDQLKKLDRDVIVCMVGDHGPSFTGQIANDPGLPETLLLRTSVPFVIWANYPLSDPLHLDESVISMNYLVPSLLKTANVALSPYYQQMITLEAEVPILTAYSGYYDKYGTLYGYDEPGEYAEPVHFYQCLEYHNFQQTRNQSLFEPYHVS